MTELNTDARLLKTAVMPSAYILSDQISLYGEPDCIGFGNNDFYIKEIDRNNCCKKCLKIYDLQHGR